MRPKTCLMSSCSPRMPTAPAYRGDMEDADDRGRGFPRPGDPASIRHGVYRSGSSQGKRLRALRGPPWGEGTSRWRALGRAGPGINGKRAEAFVPLACLGSAPPRAPASQAPARSEWARRAEMAELAEARRFQPSPREFELTILAQDPSVTDPFAKDPSRSILRAKVRVPARPVTRLVTELKR
jgi:hypothetical protein